MSDPRALVRIVDELLWVLRRGGFEISTAQGVDVARAVRAVGLENRTAVRDAVACVVVTRARDRAEFDAVFDGFFEGRPSPPRGDIWARLAARGFDRAELDALRGLLEQLASTRADAVAVLGELLEGGADVDRLLVLSGAARGIDASSGLQL